MLSDEATWKQGISGLLLEIYAFAFTIHIKHFSVLRLKKNFSCKRASTTTVSVADFPHWLVVIDLQTNYKAVKYFCTRHRKKNSSSSVFRTVTVNRARAIGMVLQTNYTIFAPSFAFIVSFGIFFCFLVYICCHFIHNKQLSVCSLYVKFLFQSVL